MNKAILILFISFACKTACLSQVFNNNLVVYSEKGKVFTLYVNDEKINPLPQSDVKAFNINEGWQKIKIEFNEEKDKSIFKDSIRIKQFEKNENAEFTYVITDVLKNGKIQHKLEFISQGNFSGPSSPKIPEEPKEIVPLVDSATYGNLYRAKNNRPVFFNNYDEQSQKCKIALTDKDIQYAKNLISKTNDFEDQFKYVSQAIDKNCYTSDQLIILLNLMEIEMDKLKVSQRAYWHLVDKNNAVNVSKAFKYPTIKEEYSAFLKDVHIKEQQRNLNCALPLPEIQFNEILKSVKNVANEYEKTKFAKKQLIANCYSSAQIGMIAGVFIHDREKLDFVKSAYFVVTDKANYEKLADVFQFSETKAEFLKFISR